MVVHQDGVQTGDYVMETAASGLQFLVSTDVLVAQGASVFDVAAPTVADSKLGPGPEGPGPWGTLTFATSVVPRAAKVEILATGAASLRFHVGWEDTCGGTRFGAKGVAGGTDGQGRVELVSPAVVLVRLPVATGINTCYLAATAWAPVRGSLHLRIIDY
jgi:hypothetical protein